MNIEDCTTPEEIRQVLNAALKYFECEGSQEKCKRVYDKAYDRAKEIWDKYYDILPEPPKHIDDYRTGAKDIAVWSRQADQIIVAIPHKLNLSVLNNVIAQFKTLDEVPASARSLIDDDLWQKAQKKAEKEQSEAADNILKFAKQNGREPHKQAAPSERALERRPEAIWIYMEMDQNFVERLSEIQKAVTTAIGSIVALLAPATTTGRLITAYCKLTDRSLNQYLIAVHRHFKKNAFRFDSALMETIFFPEIGNLIAIESAVTILTRIRNIANSTGKKIEKATTPAEGEKPIEPPSEPMKLAWESHKWVAKNRSDLVPDDSKQRKQPKHSRWYSQQMYDYLKENGPFYENHPDESKQRPIPSYGAWTRYLRQYVAYQDRQKSEGPTVSDQPESSVRREDVQDQDLRRLSSRFDLDNPG